MAEERGFEARDLQSCFCERCSASGPRQCPFQAWVAKDSTAMGWAQSLACLPQPQPDPDSLAWAAWGH